MATAGKHFVGIRNQGGTCYLNAILQEIFMNKTLRSMVNSIEAKQLGLLDKSKKTMKRMAILIELQKIIAFLEREQTSKSRSAATTKALTDALGLKAKDVLIHEDLNEFWLSLMHKMEGLMPRDKFIGVPYTGVFAIRTQCDECIERKESPTKPSLQQFFQINVEVKGHKGLLQYLDHSFGHYVEILQLEDGNAYFCDHVKCKKLVRAQRTWRFASFPPVLKMNLKRFSFDRATVSWNKNTDPFDFPIDLIMDKYLDGYQQSECYF